MSLKSVKEHVSKKGICFLVFIVALLFFNYSLTLASELRSGGEPGPKHTNQLTIYNIDPSKAEILDDTTVKILINTSGHGPITGIEPVAEKDYWLQLLANKSGNYQVDWYDGIPNYNGGGDGDLNDYDFVIYDAGGYWYPLSYEVDPLYQYHMSGRPLIVVAPDVNFDWDNIKSSSVPNFCEEVLHIGGVRGTMPGDNYSIIANTGHEIINSMATGTEIPVAQQSSYPDCFDPLNDAEGVLRQGQSTTEFDRGTVADNPSAYSYGPDGNLYGVTAYSGSGSEGRVVLFGFPPTAIQNSSLLDQLCSNSIDFALGQVQQSKKVKLDNMYVDDAGDKDILVNKAKGDLIEVVHSIINNETTAQNVTLTTTVPDDWIFKFWYYRLDSKGTNYSKHEDKHQDLGNGVHQIEVGHLTGPEIHQIGIRFQIPESVSSQDVSISSQISLEDGVPLVANSSTKASIVSSAQAIIVTNRDNLYGIYQDTNGKTTELLKTLFSIADGKESGEVKSVVYYADWYDEDIRDWDNQDANLYDGTPNDVADDLDSLVEGWAQNLFIACPQYILIVGGDEILPFYRIKDPMWDIPIIGTTEKDYVALTVTSNDYYFSDTKYADLENDDYMKGELEAEIGRIVGANVTDMKKLILTGLKGPKGGEKVVIASSGDPCLDTDDAFNNFENNGFAILNNGGDDDTIENNNWTSEVFKNAVNQNVKFIVEFTHANHTTFASGNGESITTNYIENNVNKLNNDEGFFIGVGGCHGGAIEERSDSNSSSLVYKFISKGVCGYLGGSGYVFANFSCGMKSYGESLFDSFWNNLSQISSIGTSYRLACVNYDAGWVWSGTEKKAATEFNLFGIPWMKPNFPEGSSTSSILSDLEKAYSIEESKPKKLKDQTIFGGETYATFSKDYTFTVTDYNISQEGTFDLVNITGADFDYNPFEPVLPKLMATLNLPKDSSVTAVQLIGGNTQSLGQLNIPNSQPSTTTNPLPGFTDYTEVTGLYPLTNYGYDIDHYNDHVEVKIYFIPVQHNVDTKETTLWNEATVEVQYSVDENIFISDFSASKSEYICTENISTTAVVENVGSEDASGLKAVLTLVDSQGQALNSTQQNLATVPAGENIETSIDLSNGLDTGSYSLRIEIKDGTDSTLALSSEYIKVTSEFIAAFAIPAESPNTGVDIPFTVTFQNYNQYGITVDVQIKIYNNIGEKVATLIAPTENLQAQSTADIVTYWNTLNKATGNYKATATATVGSKQYSANSQFLITGSGILSLISGLGSYPTNGGWIEAFASDYSNANWFQVNWGDYNSANGESRVATGDIDGDGKDEIVIGLGPVSGNSSIPGGWFEVLDDNYSHLAWGRVDWSAYNSANGETWPACGDVDGDGKAEIIMGLGAYPANGGWFEIFDYEAGSVTHKAWKQVNWPSYNSQNGETRPATGDIDNDGKDEIVVGLGSGGLGWIEIFDDASSGYSHLKWHQVQWSDYNTQNGETWPACGDVDGDGKAEIIVGLGTYPANGGWFEIFDYDAGSVTHKAWKQVNWPSYNSQNGETRPATGDIDNDGKDEIVVGLGSGGGGWMEVFDDASAGYPHLAWPQVHWPNYNIANGGTWPAVKK
jgi:hypothetical protein